MIADIFSQLPAWQQAVVVALPVGIAGFLSWLLPRYQIRWRTEAVLEQELRSLIAPQLHAPHGGRVRNQPAVVAELLKRSKAVRPQDRVSPAPGPAAADAAPEPTRMRPLPPLPTASAEGRRRPAARPAVRPAGRDAAHG